MISHAHARATLEAYMPEFPEEKVHLARMKVFLEAHKNPFTRENLIGHFTASAWIVDPSYTQALLIFHKKLQKWLQPGGHIETDDETFSGASLREAEEEIGVTGFLLGSSTIFDVDIHPIPERHHEPAHEHFDVRYLWVLPTTDISCIDFQEVEGACWRDIDLILADTATPPEIRRMAEKTVRWRKERRGNFS